MNAMRTINIGSEFSRTPGGRRYADGPDSGELFRERFLVPGLRQAIAEDGMLNVILDGPRGYLSSFIEEAFGGLIRLGYFSKSELSRYLRVTANDPFYETYRRLAIKYMDEARPEAALAS